MRDNNVLDFYSGSKLFFNKFYKKIKDKNTIIIIDWLLVRVVSVRKRGFECTKAHYLTWIELGKSYE